VTNFTKKFGANTVVDGLSLQIEDHSIFCLLGHNGAGKSTTINAMVGLVPKTSGHILYQHLNVDTDLPLIRRKLGLCLQSDVLY
jgi:ATP-binding cassette subfamily A (ABC1) protein 3